MSVIEAIVWGVLQGLTEFLPVSSSGHLALAPWLTGRQPSSFTFDVLVHLATLCAVLFYFRHDLVPLARGLVELARTRQANTPEARLAGLIAVSAVPAMVVGVVFRRLVEQLFDAPPAAAAFLLVTGAILFLAESLEVRERDMTGLRIRDALAIGVAQSLALAPGISRSGATISAGLALGLRRSDAARFAFLMSIPVVLGATALEGVDLLQGAVPSESALVLGVGFAAALISGYAAIAVLLRYLQRRGLRPFAYYCWALGVFGLAVYVLR